jgi:HSP20 family protein
MAKRSRRRRTAQSRQRSENRQQLAAAQNREAEDSTDSSPRERTVAILHEAARQANPLAAQQANPFEPMERLMQAFMPFTWLRPWMSLPPAPKLDVIDRDSSVLVRAEVPGVQKSHLAVEASDTAVTIKGEIRHDESREDERYRISETSRGAFERTVSLPTEVDSTKAKATFKDGVVEVTLPKVDRSRSHQLKF